MLQAVSFTHSYTPVTLLFATTKKELVTKMSQRVRKITMFTSFFLGGGALLNNQTNKCNCRNHTMACVVKAKLWSRFPFIHDLVDLHWPSLEVIIFSTSSWVTNREVTRLAYFSKQLSGHIVFSSVPYKGHGLINSRTVLIMRHKLCALVSSSASSSSSSVPLTMSVDGWPWMTLQPVFPCSPFPSGTCGTPGLSVPTSIQGPSHTTACHQVKNLLH